MQIARIQPIRRFWPPIARSMVLALMAASFAASAADAVFPPGSRIGLTPSPGFVISHAFNGFEDRERNAAIVIIELPAKAYVEIEKTLTVEAAAKEGVTAGKRENFPVSDGKAILLSGDQETNGVRIRRILLLASIADLTALITIQIPDAAKQIHQEADIRAALGTLRTRPVPMQEQLDMLPFKLGELSGFRVTQVIGHSAAVLTDGPKDDIANVEQPHFLVTVAASAPIEPSNRENFARQLLASLSAFKDMRVIFSEAMRLGGQQGYEIRVNAKDAGTGADVTIVQWLRFGPAGYIRMVGVAPKEKWPVAFSRFRAIRDGIGLH